MNLSNTLIQGEWKKLHNYDTNDLKFANTAKCKYRILLRNGVIHLTCFETVWILTDMKV